MTQVTHISSETTLGDLRSASTGAFSTLLIFLLCWAGAVFGRPLVLSHSFVASFTLEPGGVAEAIIAHCYNLAGRWLGV